MTKLLQEQRSGWAELRLALDGKPLRVVRAVNVPIVSDDGRRTLVCTHRTASGGERREVGQPLSGKLRAAEAEAEAAQRCAKEELGVGVALVPGTRSEHTAAKSTSSAFPGLLCRFMIVTLDATVAMGTLKQENLDTNEMKDSERTTHHWSWHPRIALPAGKEMPCV